MAMNHLYLAPEQVVLRIGNALHQAAVSEANWLASLTAAQALLHTHNVQGKIAIIVSQAFAPIWLLPSAAARLSEDETRAWVTSRLSERFGDLAAHWRIAFQPVPQGKSILVSALEAEQWMLLLQMIQRPGIKIISVMSWPALALMHYRKRCSSARLVLLEASRLSLVSLAYGDVVALESARIDTDSDVPALCSDLVKRARLVDGLGVGGNDGLKDGLNSGPPLCWVATGVALNASSGATSSVLANSLAQCVLSSRGELDFLRTRFRPPLAAWLLLAAGLGLVGLAGERYLALQAQQVEWRSAAPMVDAKPKRKPSSVKDASELARQRDWSILLAGLENNYPTEGVGAVALLSLRADASKGEVQLSAETRSEAAMLAWLHHLRRDFSDASLLQHNVQHDSASLSVVRFDIHLYWGAR